MDVIRSETDVAWGEHDPVADFLEGLTFIEERHADNTKYDFIVKSLEMCNMGIEVWLDDREFVSRYRETQLAYFYNMRDKYLNDLKGYRVGRIAPSKPWPRR